jgi:hypothetical protein
MYAGRPGVSRVEREVLFLPPSIAVVFDRVEGASDTARIWQLNSPVAPTLAGPVATFAGATSTLTVRRILPASPTVQVVDWAATDTDMVGGGFRLDASDSGSGGVSRFFHVLSLDGSVTGAVADDNGTQRGVTIALAQGGSFTVRFGQDTWGGTVQARDAAGSPTWSVSLSPGVETLPLFAGTTQPTIRIGNATISEGNNGTTTLSFTVTRTE